MGLGTGLGVEYGKGMEKRLAGALAIVFFPLTFTVSCTKNSDGNKGTEIVCAFVEGYLETKVLAMTLPKGQSIDFVEATVPTAETLKGSFEIGDTQEAVLEEFRSSMIDWAIQLEQYKLNKDGAALKRAGITLETSIDSISSECQELGWEFKKDWRV